MLWSLCQSCFVKNLCFYELLDLPVFYVHFLIPLLVSTGFAPLAGIKGLGTHSQGVEAFSQGPALPRDSHMAPTPRAAQPTSGDACACVSFRNGSGEGLSKNLTFPQQCVPVQQRQGCGWDMDRGRGRRARVGAEAKGQGQRSRGKKGMGQVHRGRDTGTRTWTGLKDRGWSRGTKGWIKG